MGDKPLLDGSRPGASRPRQAHQPAVRSRNAPTRVWRDKEAQSISASRGYVRERDLPRLLPILSRDLAVRDEDSHRRLVDILRRALRQERARGLAADWSYDLGRHASLLRAYREETVLLAQRGGGGDVR